MNRAGAAVLVFFALTWGAAADPIRVEMPPEASLPPISIYEVDADAPLMQLTGVNPAELGPGHYVFGIDSYAWRSPSFEHSGETVIRLGAVALSVPEGAAASFTLHDGRRGVLLMPIDAGSAVAVPEGAYQLRRDLAETTIAVVVTEGSVQKLDFGALSVQGALPSGSAIYIAPESEDLVAGVLRPGATTLALPPGSYRLRSISTPEIVAITASPSQTTSLPVQAIRWASLSEVGGGRLLRGDLDLPLPANAELDLVLLDMAPVRVELDEQNGKAAPLQPIAERWIWQNPDGGLAHEAGIPLTIAPGQLDVALPGGALNLRATLAAGADAQLTVRQGDRLLSDQTLRLRRGVSDFSTALPEDLMPEIPIEVLLTLGPDGAPISGRLGPVSVHRFLATAPGGLTLGEARSTTLRLTWDAVTEGGIEGYMVFRGESDFPVSGRRPRASPVFTDLALSAGRKYNYRVCGVDRLGHLGPCSSISVETPPAE
jgi:hypothetical protein